MVWESCTTYNLSSATHENDNCLIYCYTYVEPGFYQEGEFGIRLENIIMVVNVTLENNFQDRGFLGFEDLTFVPYQHKLIKTELLTQQEVIMVLRYI